MDVKNVESQLIIVFLVSEIIEIQLKNVNVQKDNGIVIIMKIARIVMKLANRVLGIIFNYLIIKNKIVNA